MAVRGGGHGRGRPRFRAATPLLASLVALIAAACGDAGPGSDPAAAGSSPAPEATGMAAAEEPGTLLDAGRADEDLPFRDIEVDGRVVRMWDIVGRDAIPAIFEPAFVTPSEVGGRLSDDELVIGVSINGEHHAYGVALLSGHEVVNDVVGGVPIAVTW